MSVACNGMKVELSELHELHSKWLMLEEAVKKEIEEVRIEKSKTIQARKVENPKATLNAHDEARKGYFEAVRDWASRKKS